MVEMERRIQISQRTNNMVGNKQRAFYLLYLILICIAIHASKAVDRNSFTNRLCYELLDVTNISSTTLRSKPTGRLT
ncbi:hypothetical protein BJX96DRAFT_76048 [Aspergillus floccosus]